MVKQRRSLRTLVLIAGCFLIAGTASAVGIPPCVNFSGQSVTSSTSLDCSVQDKLFQFIGSSPNVDIGSSLSSPAGLEFFGNDGGEPIDFSLEGGTINIEYIVSVINPFNGNPNPLLITASDIPSLIDGTANGSLGGTVSFCVGEAWNASGVPNPSGFDGTFTGDDGCAANGGTFASTALSSGTVFNFNPQTTSVAVWDQISVSPGAGFGSLEETFIQTPEPMSLLLLGSGILAMLCKRLTKTDAGK